MKAGSQPARQLPVTVNTPLPTQVHSQNQVQEHKLHRLMQHWCFMFPHSPQLNGFAFRPGVHTLRHVPRFVSFGACQAQRVKMSRQWTTPRLTDLATWEAYLRHLRPQLRHAFCSHNVVMYWLEAVDSSSDFIDYHHDTPLPCK